MTCDEQTSYHMMHGCCVSLDSQVDNVAAIELVPVSHALSFLQILPEFQVQGGFDLTNCLQIT